MLEFYGVAVGFLTHGSLATFNRNLFTNNYQKPKKCFKTKFTCFKKINSVSNLNFFDEIQIVSIGKADWYIRAVFILQGAWSMVFAATNVDNPQRGV